MSCAYLFIRSRHGIDDARRRYESAARFAPLVPETTWTREVGENAICGAFSNASESAGGNYVHAWDDGRFVVFNGWVAGNGLSDQPFSTSVSSWIDSRIQATSFDQFVADTTGEWSVLAVSHSGEINAGFAFPGGEHLYYGVMDGVFVMSNRAILCAVALHGHIPAPNPFFVGWLLTSNHAFLSDNGTPFAGVHALHPLKILKLARDATAWEVRERPWPQAPTLPSVDEMLEGLVQRVNVVRRLPNVPFRLSLTGGRDSRLVLAGLVAAKSFDKLRGCYLIAAPDHPDVIVGQLLAEHYGIPFECLPREASTRSVWDDLKIHHFQSEMGIHFWDSKGVLSQSREGRMGGNYGEMFFSHQKIHQSLGWPGVAGFLESNWYVDPDGILTNRARAHFRQGIRTFWQNRRDEGLLPTQIRDRLHRDGRMWRWVGQGRLSISLGAVNTNPIPSPGMLDKYISSPFLDRWYGRIHYEIMRRVDPWIAEQPFASKGFSAYLTGHRQRRMVFPPAKRTVAPQHTLWQTQRNELCSYLLAPAKSEFFEIVDKKRLEKLLRRTGVNAARLEIATVLGILGVRHALEEPIQPFPCKVESA